MYQCNYCELEFEHVEQLAGHRSGHVRRGEIEKGFAKRPKRERRRKEFHLIRRDRTRKAHLLLERGHRCELCMGETHRNQPIPLEIDHIDGNSRNNEKENLRLLCPNCHAQTDTYRGRNIGKNPDLKRAETLKKHYGKYR